MTKAKWPTTWPQLAKLKKLHPVNSLPFPKPKDNRQKSVNADFVLDVLAEHMNTDSKGKRWKPDRNDGNWKYFPVFTGNVDDDSFSFYDSFWYYYPALSAVGSRLEYETREKSDHAGKHFLKFYKQRSTI